MWPTFDKLRQVSQATIVENKHLGAVLAHIRERQIERAEARSHSAPRRQDKVLFLLEPNDITRGLRPKRVTVVDDLPYTTSNHQSSEPSSRTSSPRQSRRVRGWWVHGLGLGVETLRQWMICAGRWVRRKDRLERIPMASTFSRNTAPRARLLGLPRFREITVRTASPERIQ
jgi:hypothetical protein